MRSIVNYDLSTYNEMKPIHDTTHDFAFFAHRLLRAGEYKFQRPRRAYRLHRKANLFQ